MWEIHTIVFCIVIKILDGISPTNRRGMVIGIAFVGREVDFFE